MALNKILRITIMKNIVSRLSGALCLFLFMVPSLFAQQLKVNNVWVGYTGTTDPYCTVDIDSTSANNKSSIELGDAAAAIEFDSPYWNPETLSGGVHTYPGACLSLCMNIQCITTDSIGGFAINDASFEIFKYEAGTNPLDTSSAPPIKTIFITDMQKWCRFDDTSYRNKLQDLGNACVAWDGSYNLNGDFGKTNGYFGFRAKVTANSVTTAGSQVDIEQTTAYPGENQAPVHIDVVDIHQVVSSATAVGSTTKVAAQPYNIIYQLSKDATASVRILDAGREYSDGTFPVVRTVVNDKARVGEGSTTSPVTNGDYWTGRNDNGMIVPSGSYMYRIDAGGYDGYGADTAEFYKDSIALDPLQITDLGTKALGNLATSQAVISYTLTEDATVFVQIYSPGTSLVNLNNDGYIDASNTAHKYYGTGDVFYSTDTNMAHPSDYDNVKPLRTIIEHKTGRSRVNTYWDGRDEDGNFVDDGDYVYAIYAELTSTGSITCSGTSACAVGDDISWKAITTKETDVGTISVSRGDPLTWNIPSSTVIGSSPTVSSLNPFYFKYTPVRDVNVTLNIIDKSSSTVRTLVDNQVRAAGYTQTEIWDGKDDSGNFIITSSVPYYAELTAADDFGRTFRTTVGLSVNLYRTTDVSVTGIDSANASAKVSYVSSQAMYRNFTIFDKTYTVETDSSAANIINSAPANKYYPFIVRNENGTQVNDPDYVYQVSGDIPARNTMTEVWDGRDLNSYLSKDGSYPFVLVTSSTYNTGTDPSTGKKNIVYPPDRVYGTIQVSRGKISITSFQIVPTTPTLTNTTESDVELPPYTIAYTTSRDAYVSVDVLDSDSSKICARVLGTSDSSYMEYREGSTPHLEYWDAKGYKPESGSGCTEGHFAPNGNYIFRVSAVDINKDWTTTTTEQIEKYVEPLQIYDVAVGAVDSNSSGVISYQVSEPMKVMTLICASSTTIADSAYYCGDADNTKLVKRIVSVRPSRTVINESWDGTDYQGSKVGAGSYPFRIVASTTSSDIVSATGEVSDTDHLIFDGLGSVTIPVNYESDSTQICPDFASGSFFAPNPYKDQDSLAKGWFKIPITADGKLIISIYNLAGDLIYKWQKSDLSSGTVIGGSSSNCDGTIQMGDGGCWPKVNNAGKKVSRGVYFAVLRFEEKQGAGNICQTVKKILIP